jgi:SnoaL-like protein
MRADELADRLAITDQMYRYCRSVDRLDVPLGHSIFHPDSTADFGVYKGSGRGWIDFICVEHRKFLYHSHQVTNVIIDLDGDRAGSEAYVFATLQARQGEKIVQHQFWARYIDKWSKRDGHWAIDNRDCIVDFATLTEVNSVRSDERSRRDQDDASYAVLEEVQ